MIQLIFDEAISPGRLRSATLHLLAFLSGWIMGTELGFPSSGKVAFCNGEPLLSDSPRSMSQQSLTFKGSDPTLTRDNGTIREGDLLSWQHSFSLFRICSFCVFVCVCFAEVDCVVCSDLLDVLYWFNPTTVPSVLYVVVCSCWCYRVCMLMHIFTHIHIIYHGFAYEHMQMLQCFFFKHASSIILWSDFRLYTTTCMLPSHAAIKLRWTQLRHRFHLGRAPQAPSLGEILFQKLVNKGACYGNGTWWNGSEDSERVGLMKLSVTTM